MSLESATYISNLVSTNPPGTDLRSQGDDHIRLIKSVLQNTFPNASKPFPFPNTAAPTANFAVSSGQNNTTFLVNTDSGQVTAGLPTLTSGDAGWECYFMKASLSLNPLFITPPSGTIISGPYSGLSYVRRCIPFVCCRALWTGYTFMIERAVTAPLGAILDYAGGVLPVGYEWPYGQTLSAGFYVEYYAYVQASGFVPDLRGRVGAGKDDMGGPASGRLAGSGITGTTMFDSGGSPVVTLTTPQLPAHSHANFLNDPGHLHGQLGTSGQAGSGAATSLIQNFVSGSGNGSTAIATTGMSITNASTGDGVYHQNTQPTIIVNKIVVVE